MKTKRFVALALVTVFTLVLSACVPAPAANAPAVLIIGDIGAGKTTTGLALLHAGWKLLSNDSPILTADAGVVSVLAYPGLLSAYPDTLARFSELGSLILLAPVREKTIFAAEAVYPDVWLSATSAGVLLFPQIENRPEHALEPLSPPEALQLILPHAIEQWDRAMIPSHLALLTQLIQTTPAYRLRLGPDTDTLPAILASTLDKSPLQQPAHDPIPPRVR